MKIAVLLNGCGHRDGSEVHEAVLTLLAIENEGYHYQCFSLNKNQTHTYNHLSGELEASPRNMLVESARISRGNIKEISELKINDYDALLIPGGSGTAANFCNFAEKGVEMTVETSVKDIIISAYEMKKPIGAICISPILIASVLGSNGITLTSGNSPDVARAMLQMGAKHTICKKGECIVDTKHKIISTPAYMYSDSKISEVLLGISSMLKQLKKLKD